MRSAACCDFRKSCYLASFRFGCDVPDSVISGEKVIKNEEDMVPVLRKFSIVGETHIADNLTMTWEV